MCRERKDRMRDPGPAEPSHQAAQRRPGQRILGTWIGLEAPQCGGASHRCSASGLVRNPCHPSTGFVVMAPGLSPFPWSLTTTGESHGRNRCPTVCRLVAVRRCASTLNLKRHLNANRPLSGRTSPLQQRRTRSTPYSCVFRNLRTTPSLTRPRIV